MNMDKHIAGHGMRPMSKEESIGDYAAEVTDDFTRRIFSGPPEPDDLPITEEDLELSLAEFRRLPLTRKEMTMANVNYDPSKLQNAKEGPMARLLRALNSLEQAEKMTDGCADHLCGSAPASEVKPPIDEFPSALFPALTAMANRIERHAQSITENMHRIERSIS